MGSRCFGAVGLPVGLGGGEVEGLFFGARAEGIEACVGGGFVDEGGELLGGFFGRAWVEGVGLGKMHDAEEGGLDGGCADDVLEEGWEICVGGGERQNEEDGAG